MALSFEYKENKDGTYSISKNHLITLNNALVKFFAFIGIAIICFGCCTTPKPKHITTYNTGGQGYYGSDANVQHLLNSTVTIVNPIAQGVCSGFFISPDLIMTAKHCFVDEESPVPSSYQTAIAESVDVPFFTYQMYKDFASMGVNVNDPSYNGPKAHAVYVPLGDYDPDKIPDMVILQVSSGRFKSKDWLPISDANPPRLASRIYAATQPTSFPWILTQGIVSEYLFDRSSGKPPFRVHRLLISMPVDFGSSGGAIIDDSGEVVGLVTHKNGAGNIGIAISPLILKEQYDLYLKEVNKSKQPPPAASPPTPQKPAIKT